MGRFGGEGGCDCVCNFQPALNPYDKEKSSMFRYKSPFWTQCNPMPDYK